MRKFLIGAAITASAAASVPAAAQWSPQPQPRPYGYDQRNPDYGHDQNGYGRGYGDGRGLMNRLDRVSQRIEFLARRNVLSQREAYGLDREARRLRERVQRVAWNGVDQRERFEIAQRIDRLEQRVRINANDRDGRLDNRWDDGRRY